MYPAVVRYRCYQLRITISLTLALLKGRPNVQQRLFSQGRHDQRGNDCNCTSLRFTLRWGVLSGTWKFQPRQVKILFRSIDVVYFKFLSSRWDSDSPIKPNPNTYMPFGMGPRNCIGMRFALEEMKIALCTILSRFRFFPVTETPVSGGASFQCLSLLTFAVVIILCNRIKWNLRTAFKALSSQSTPLSSALRRDRE